jgi:hypothetical protein
MRKEKLIDLFQGLTLEDIKPLPGELSVCWYPSSGNHFNSEHGWNSYVAAQHWKEQPSKSKPNLFIFSDIGEFQTPPGALVLLNRKPPNLTHFPKLTPFIMDYNQHIIQDGRILLFDWGLGSFHDYNKVTQPTNLDEREIVYGYSRMILHYFQGHFFLLLQTNNRRIYDCFMQRNVQIPMLTINRPCDEFITSGGISLDALGVEELIVGGVYHHGFDLNQFKKHPEFIFQRFDNDHLDMANLYSRS